jgi:tRNA (adenine37-N6)-methyltransferase
MMDKIIYSPIGLIHSPYKTLENIPVQNSGSKNMMAEIEIFPQFIDGLKDIDGFSHLILLYHFHQVHHFQLLVKPFLDDEEHGIFATRAPIRPNPVGLTVVKLLEIRDSGFIFEGPDMIDKTPLIDIKPFIHMVDEVRQVKSGWLENKIHLFETKKSDNRFI